MFRFLIGNEEWILRFSPNIELDSEIKQAIYSSLIQLGETFVQSSHGDSFSIIDEQIGMIIFTLEKIPSLILTVSHVVPKERWYTQCNLSIKPYQP
ncbi:hypothetical protein ACQCVH_21350 [Bacillus infantis]|uniref:hypothetical protein n=1 Tax=Bacillus infantis TaxID=324767 RepID=UPI003CF2BDC6